MAKRPFHNGACPTHCGPASAALPSSCSLPPLFRCGADSPMNMGGIVLISLMFQIYESSKGPKTWKHDSTPMQFEVKIALTRNRGYERKGRRRSKQRQRARRPSQPMHAHSPATTDRQHSLQPPKSKQASKRRKGKREDGRAENVDHYRRKLASDGRNDGRTEEGRTPRGRWAQVRRNCRRRCLRGRAQNWRFPTKCSTK